MLVEVLWLFAGDAIDRLAKQVRMTVVARVLLDQMHQNPAQVSGPACGASSKIRDVVEGCVDSARFRDCRVVASPDIAYRC